MLRSTMLRKLRILYIATVSLISDCIICSSHVTPGCRIEYLPPYSPDYNPIEQAFSVIKAHLRRQGFSFFQSKALYYEMYRACDFITPEMTWGFFAHAGYMV
jgi:hypothetical protein